MGLLAELPCRFAGRRVHFRKVRSFAPSPVATAKRSELPCQRYRASMGLLA